MIFLLFFLFTSISCQSIKQLNEISLDEEIPIGTIVTYLTDKIPNLEQSIEYDLVTPLSTDLDLFRIDHLHHSLLTKKRLDFEELCVKKSSHCVISISIAVSNQNTIDVYILPIHLRNLNDNPIKFPVNRTVIEIYENDDNYSKQTYPLPRAIDLDGDNITYSLYLQNWSKPTGLFELDETNLLLKPLKKFDREEQNLYVLRLVAQENISIDIIVIIKDVNDNPPQCYDSEKIFEINSIDSISLFTINVTDFDEGDNGKLEYRLINSIPGFTIDPDRGIIKFDYTRWIRRNPSVVLIKITDYGKPNRLSTECHINFKFTNLFDINLQINNEENGFIPIENIHLPVGQLIINDKQMKKSCENCLIEINSSLNDVFYLNEKTFDLYLNLNSIILMRILSNNLIKKEYLPINVMVNVKDKTNHLISSSKNYSLILNFNKDKLLINSNVFFSQIQENMILNEEIQIFNQIYHPCLNNQSKQLKLIDSTNTFEMNEKLNLIIKKYLYVKQQQYYELILKDMPNNQTYYDNQCSIQLRIYVYNPYSIITVYPYFSQSFYILNSNNLTEFLLPSLPSHVKYISSKPNEVSIDEKNGSIRIQSTSLYSYYYYDFYIQAIDSQTPSLTCSIPIRIFFGINHESPRLFNNFTKKESIEISMSSTGSIYQLEGYDPDISINTQNRLFPPSIEYEIYPSENLEIERYTGRLFLKTLNQSTYNFTLILTDFGQPNRLMTRQSLTLNILSNEKLNRKEIRMFISKTFLLISVGVFSIFILFMIIIFLVNCWSSKSSSTTSKSISNLSPTTPDSRLIDNEYITTTTTLPRVINREQRIYPTIANDNQRKLLEQIHIPSPSVYTAEKVFIKHDYQQNLSINDINKYLERFEKIYNHSPENPLREPVGSVV